ncbi:MAG: HesA/MoeB/ThiF family protein [Chloroflexota bacterium]
MLTAREVARYQRQIMIDGFGEEGQEKLKKARVFIAGVGGLGAPAALYLAAAGVGTLRIVDPDSVELANLNRQVLHWDDDIGRHKVGSAAEKLKRLNGSVVVEAVEETISGDNASRLVAGCDVIVDALDNLPARYALNRAALENKLPLCHGAVYGFEGRAMTVIPGQTACLMCLYRGASGTGCPRVIGVTPAIIGCIQAMEAIKYIVGLGELLTDRLLSFNGLNMKFTEFRVKRDPECADCGHPGRKGGE